MRETTGFRPLAGLYHARAPTRNRRLRVHSHQRSLPRVHQDRPDDAGPEGASEAALSRYGHSRPYAVAWKVYVSDCNLVERLAHEKLASHRTRNNREFFRLSVEDAIQAISEIATPYKGTTGLQTPDVSLSEAHQRVDEGPGSGCKAPEPRPEPTRCPDPSLAPVENRDATYLSVESHAAEQMAPTLKPAKLEVLRKLREAILRVAPDCLWRMRDDGKIIFTPLPHKDRSRFRNLMTMHLQENPFRYRIGKVLTRFSDEQLGSGPQLLPEFMRFGVGRVD